MELPKGDPPCVAAIIPAKDEADRVAATIAAVASLPHVDLVIVVDDGSSDDTPRVAAAAGAIVVRHATNQGKSTALATGVARLVEEERQRGLLPHLLLFVDADLQGTAANLEPLIDVVRAGRADLAVANIPRHSSSHGAGRVVRLARGQIMAMTGCEIAQPLNGMRCLTRAAFEAATPLAPGWGVEAAMLVDVLRAGLRVREVPVRFEHRASGANWSGRMHRARQLRDVSRAMAERRFRS
ncbi:glycosyltransferase family 2 protein [Janibacter sp. GXQ6167]|uniref:glycosyltransferase family 2 protein n=1 Tax=Janibacter sp. GXQ6167 TaxID=3240791 RepID=UPI0035235621